MVLLQCMQKFTICPELHNYDFGSDGTCQLQSSFRSPVGICYSEISIWFDQMYFWIRQTSDIFTDYQRLCCFIRCWSQSFNGKSQKFEELTSSAVEMAKRINKRAFCYLTEYICFQCLECTDFGNIFLLTIHCVI